MSIKTRALLSDFLPFWFAMMSPLFGVIGGFLIAWLLSRY